MTAEVDVCVEGESFNLIESLSIIIGLTCLMILVYIAFLTIPQLAALHKLEKSFKHLFYSSFVSSFILIILTILSTFLCVYKMKLPSIIVVTFAVYFYYFLLLSLLLTLLARLHFTFIDSVYRVSAATRKFLLVLFLIVCALALCNILTDMVSFFDTNLFHQNVSIASTLALIFGASSIFMYTLTALYAMGIFTHNLIKLTHLQASSPQHAPFPQAAAMAAVAAGNMTLDESSGSRSNSFLVPSVTTQYKLNKNQMELIENISKYVSLLSFAMLSSLVVAVAILCGIWSKKIVFRTHFYQIILIFACVDVTINVICLYLQYAFAMPQYKRYCRCIHWLCRCVLRRTAKKSGQKMMHRRSLEQRSSMTASVGQQHRMDMTPIEQEEKKEELEVEVLAEQDEIVNEQDL